MIPNNVQSQKKYFLSGETKCVAFRKERLKALKTELLQREDAIIGALKKDFNKPEFESVLSETAVVISEIDRILKKLSGWAKPKRVFPSLLNFRFYRYNLF